MNKSDFLSYGFKFFVAVLFVLVLEACSNDDAPAPAPEPEPVPASTFKLHIGEENVAQMDINVPDCYPSMYYAILVMEDLPVDEKIINMGGVYSAWKQEPDISDCTLIYDYSDYEQIQEWDWEKEPLYWRCMFLFHPLPCTTYYVRGYVQTDKGEYYSNTIEIRSDIVSQIPQNPDIYNIPVVFHVFPDVDGNYSVKDWMIKEQLDYANNVFGNYYNIPGQTETGVRFVAATHAPDGSLLETPGIVHEAQAVEIDPHNIQMPGEYIWDMELALNVWVCPIKVADEDMSENYELGGFTFLPFMDADEMLDGCYEYTPGIVTGIFLNATAMTSANEVVTFAHEAGHFLALEHVFAPGDDFCDDTPWYDYSAHWVETDGTIDLTRISDTGEVFLSDNVMDYEYGFMTGFTPDQLKRIRYALQHAYFIPGEAGKEEPVARSFGQSRHFVGKPIH